MAEKYTIYSAINNGKGYNDSEQRYQAIPNYDLYKKDTDNVFLSDANTAIEVDVSTIEDGDYIDITKDDSDNVFSLKIKE